MIEPFTFALNTNDQTPEWASTSFLVQILRDGRVAAFASPQNDYDLYDEINPQTAANPTLDAMLAAAHSYKQAGRS
ncbi:hypothetical protein [Gordonia sihwensis]|uniref:hypothetical protein n=1 Tax=Gordonia sihwensis TaxID=173559 RepID=UPI003D994DDB